LKGVFNLKEYHFNPNFVYTQTYTQN